MKKYEKLVNKLEKAGKLEKIDILSDIIAICYQEKNHKITDYFDKFIGVLEDYLSFDKNPTEAIRRQISNCYRIIFNYIQKSNQLDLFHRYKKIFDRYTDYIDDSLDKAEIYQRFGYFYWLQQKIDTSIRYLRESLAIANNFPKAKKIPGRYTNLGFLYESTGQYDKAEKIYLKGLKYAQANNYNEALKMAYAAMGRLNLSKKNYATAIDYFHETLSLYEKDAKDPNRIAIINNLALAYTRSQKHEEALEYFNKIKQDWVKQRNPELFYSTSANMSISLMKLKRYSEAEKELLKSIKFSEKHGAVEQLGGSYINLATVYFYTNRLTESNKYSKKALKLAKKSNHKRQQLTIYILLADIEMKRDNSEQVLKHYNKAVELASEQNSHKDLLNIYQKLSEAYAENSNYKKAYISLQKSIKHKEKYKQELEKKDKELMEANLIKTGKKKEYLYKSSTSLISSELSKKIGSQLIGKSPKMEALIEQAFLASGNANSSVLIKGESGTGKDLLAKLIHHASSRANSPFIAINSAAFTSGLAQSTLFGHEKGAFTGAHTKQIGHFESAEGGTIFLDEIAEMPMEIQSKLLRVLEEKAIKRLGSSHKIKVDFRLISATHRKILKLVSKNKFRFDLINRINTLEIEIPPLRERKHDIPLLINHYMRTISEKLGKKMPTLSNKALYKLHDYDYPGNVRELINILERLILFCKNDRITIDDIYFSKLKSEKEITKFKTLNLTKNEKMLIKEALKKADNVKTEAARLLGISYYSLNRRLKKWKIT